MIGISERDLKSDISIEKIKLSHNTFTGQYVERIITFYIKIFELLITIEGKRISSTTINANIKKIKVDTNSSDYKSLLNALLKKNYSISKETHAFTIKYSNKRNKNTNNLKENLFALTELKKCYKNIIDIEFEKDLTKSLTLYEAYKLNFKGINFILPKIFNYEEWFNKLGIDEIWGPYQLTKNLNLNSCPYCNRQYTFTITDKRRKIARPELDHFLPKKQNPLLSLSFYNLIPSCHTCNSSGVKGDSIISYMTHLNPYEKNEGHSLTRFTYIPKSYEAAIGLSEDLEIKLCYNGISTDSLLKKKVEGNIELLCLNNLYANHNDIVSEIIRKRAIANDKYVEILQNTFNSFLISPDDIYKLAFGNYFNETNFKKRPLSKLTKDIAIELGTLIEFIPL